MARSNGAMGASVCGMMMMMIMIIGAAAEAPAPSVDCSTEVLTLSDCLTYVTTGQTTPPAACCTELSTVITSYPQCLCLLFNTTFTAPLGVNVTLAQQLPPACKLQTPPTSLCSLVGVPVPSPATSPAARSPAAKTPASAPALAPSPKSSTPSPARSTAGPSPASSPTPMITPTAGSMGPVGMPPGPTSPNAAPLVTCQNAAVAATLLFLASIFLS